MIPLSILSMLDEADEAVFLALHHLVRSEAMDSFMWLMSDKLIWVPMYIALSWWIIVRFGWKRGGAVILAISLAALCADQTCSRLLRPLVERLRPANPDNPLSGFVYIVNEYRGGAYGFPSCHAANTFMLATFISLLARNRFLIGWMFVWAVLNCLSRIYLGVHYPGDILYGAIIGSVFTIIWSKLLKLLWKDSEVMRITAVKSVDSDYVPVAVGLITVVFCL